MGSPKWVAKSELDYWTNFEVPMVPGEKIMCVDTASGGNLSNSYSDASLCKCQPAAGGRGKVRRSPEPLAFILWVV